MSNLVPEGWAYEQLGSYISESVAGEWGVEAAGDENDIPVLRSTNFTASGIIDFAKLAYRNIEEKKRLAKSLKYGDIVLEKSGGSPTQPVGRVVYFDKNEPFLFSNFTQKLSPSNNVDSKFLFYKLYSEYQNGTVMKFQQQTTGIINFQLAEYLGFKSSFPPLREQQKIATILSSVDDVIEKTRAQIDKLKDLKTGMMQELLTKGIGHTEFKDSPVGQVPASWDVIILGDVCEFTQGVQITSADMVRDNRPGYIRYMYIRDFTSDSRLWFVKDEHPNKIITSGDLAMANTGHTSGTVYKGKYGVLSNNAFKISFDHDVVETDFLLFFLKSDFFLKKIQQLFNTAGQPHVGHGNIARMPTPLPPLAEQKRISSIMNKIETAMQEKEKAYRKYLALKKALMQDLLTGKVRVKLTDKESAVV